MLFSDRRESHQPESSLSMSNIRFPTTKRKPLRHPDPRSLAQILPAVVRESGRGSIIFNLAIGDAAEAAALRQTFAALGATASCGVP